MSTRKLKRSRRVLAAITLCQTGSVEMHKTLIVRVPDNVNSDTPEIELFRLALRRCITPTPDGKDIIALRNWTNMSSAVAVLRTRSYDEIFKGVNEHLRLFDLHRLLFITDVLFDLSFDSSVDTVDS